MKKIIISSLILSLSTIIGCGGETQSPPNKLHELGTDAGLETSCIDVITKNFPGDPVRETDEWLKTDAGLVYTRMLECVCIGTIPLCSDSAQQFNGQDLTLENACNARLINTGILNACRIQGKTDVLDRCEKEIMSCFKN